MVLVRIVLFSLCITDTKGNQSVRIGYKGGLSNGTVVRIPAPQCSNCFLKLRSAHKFFVINKQVCLSRGFPPSRSSSEDVSLGRAPLLADRSRQTFATLYSR
jgi:hypothetical protein